MNWFEIANSDELLTPALLFYPDRIKSNISQMIKIAGSADRLRPHVKTYKCNEIVRMQMDMGITKFKCATLSEAEMLAQKAVKDVLVAFPLIGPSQKKFAHLIAQYPDTQFSTLIDDPTQVEAWKKTSANPVHVFIDLNVGMNRTGIRSKEGFELFKKLDPSHFVFRGLHVYDGHIHDIDLIERESTVDLSFVPVENLLDKIKMNQLEVICGGSISFPIHAKHENRTLSPGTSLLWDHGYSQYSDLKFDVAAMIMTRVISKPGNNKICLDLGHKAVGSEMKFIPVYFPEIPDSGFVTHSEEHLVLEVDDSHTWEVGDVVYGIPEHICPTVALHAQAGIVQNNTLTEFWEIKARNRIYNL